MKDGNFKPLVSIIIPVYNGGNYLAEAIDSALGQEYGNCEVLVVNDGSDDNDETERIALSYGNKISYLKKDNGGVASALNYGIQRMKGEYFSWLSHDDVYYPDKIRLQVDRLNDEGERTATVLCDYDYWDMENDTYSCTDFSRLYEDEYLCRPLFPGVWIRIHMCAPLISRKTVEEIGLFDESLKYTQDVDYLYRLFRKRGAIWVKKSLYKVRVHSESGQMRYRYDIYRENNENTKKVLKQVSDNEFSVAFGAAETGITHLSSILFAGAEWETLNQVEQRLFALYSRRDGREDNYKFKHALNQYSNNTDVDVVLYGCGESGRRAYYELVNRGIDIKMIADRNPEAGININNTFISSCSIDELKNNYRDALVIVAVRQSDSIRDILRKEGFLYIMTKYELDGLLIKHRPWLAGRRTR